MAVSASAIETLVLVLCLSLTTSSASDGTTSGLEDIFRGRCRDYQEIIKPYAQMSVDCNILWNTFSRSFQWQEPCAENDYRSFIEASLTSLPENKAMFWSGTYQIAHDYAGSGKRFITLEDTLLGYLVNGMRWCGQTGPPGINYSNCPECPSGGYTNFWRNASSRFASLAKGIVTVVLNGSNPNGPAYSPQSYFAKFELPSMTSARVKLINVVVVHDIDKPESETCGQGSLLNLQMAIKDKKMTFMCYDNPKAVLHLLCVDNPSSSMCRMARNIPYFEPTFIG